MKEIKLFPHNQIMMDNIECAMAEGARKIFFSQACGLGKTFIFMYLVNKYFRDKRVLYITSKQHIWNGLKIKEEFKNINLYIDMCCYADFNHVKERHLKYDIYLVDEAHHLFSKVQGANVVSVMNHIVKINKDAYVFGTTATPFCNDKMAGSEFFDVSIFGKDMLDAIDEGLLQPITYSICIDDIAKNNEKIFACKSLATVFSKN